MSERIVVDATIPSYYNVNQAAAAGQFVISQGEGFSILQQAWHPTSGEFISMSKVLHHPCQCCPSGLFLSPGGLLAVGIAAAPWLPAGWLDVGMVPLNTSLLHSWVFCRALAIWAARHSRNPDEPFAGSLPAVVIARLLARRFIDPCSLPPLPAIELSLPLAIDALDDLVVKLRGRLGSLREAVLGVPRFIESAEAAPTIDAEATAIAMRAKGMSVVRIADALGVSRQSLYRMPLFKKANERLREE